MSPLIQNCVDFYIVLRWKCYKQIRLLEQIISKAFTMVLCFNYENIVLVWIISASLKIQIQFSVNCYGNDYFLLSWWIITIFTLWTTTHLLKFLMFINQNINIFLLQKKLKKNCYCKKLIIFWPSAGKFILLQSQISVLLNVKFVIP